MGESAAIRMQKTLGYFGIKTNSPNYDTPLQDPSARGEGNQWACREEKARWRKREIPQSTRT